MTDTQLLVGSLSNDLFRVASLAQRGSTAAATRFLQEARRWAIPLKDEKVAAYIRDIAHKVASVPTNNISTAQAEDYLMYGILLQNYALKAKI